MNLPCGINLYSIPMEFTDSGSSTGVGLLVVVGVALGVGLLGTNEGGGLGLGATAGVLLVATGSVS